MIHPITFKHEIFFGDIDDDKMYTKVEGEVDIDLFEVSSYHEFGEVPEELTKTVVCLRSGVEYVLLIPINEFRIQMDKMNKSV